MVSLAPCNYSSCDRTPSRSDTIIQWYLFNTSACTPPPSNPQERTQIFGLRGPALVSLTFGWSHSEAFRSWLCSALSHWSWAIQALTLILDHLLANWTWQLSTLSAKEDCNGWCGIVQGLFPALSLISAPQTPIWFCTRLDLSRAPYGLIQIASAHTNSWQGHVVAVHSGFSWEVPKFLCCTRHKEGLESSCCFPGDIWP